METDYLRELTGVVESGSFADASDELFLSQPTLYRHMKTIEEKLGADGPLFYRTPQGMRLTPLGGIIYRYAERILSAEEECRAEIRKRRAAGEALIRIAAIDTNAYPQISDALACFGEKYPDCRTHVTLAHTAYNMESLRKCDCDFAFAILGEGQGTEFCQEPVLADPLTAIIYNGHPLAEREGAVSMEELVKYPMLISGENSFTSCLCRRLFGELKIRPKIVLTSYNRATLKNMAEEELGIALMLKRQAETLHLNRSVLRPVTPVSMGHLTLLYRESALEKTVNRDFLLCVRTEREHPERGEEKRRTALQNAALYHSKMD